jgi:hypothetical protein
MTAYMPASIWLLSSALCLIIAKRRHVKQTALKSMLAAVLGPLAIAWALVAKPEQIHHAG